MHVEQDPPHARFFRTGDASDLAAQLNEFWPHCRAGADPVRESAAQAESLELGRRFGRDFVAIVREAHEKSFQKNVEMVR